MPEHFSVPQPALLQKLSQRNRKEPVAQFHVLRSVMGQLRGDTYRCPVQKGAQSGQDPSLQRVAAVTSIANTLRSNSITKSTSCRTARAGRLAARPPHAP